MDYGLMDNTHGLWNQLFHNTININISVLKFNQ